MAKMSIPDIGNTKPPAPSNTRFFTPKKPTLAAPPSTQIIPTPKFPPYNGYKLPSPTFPITSPDNPNYQAPSDGGGSYGGGGESFGIGEPGTGGPMGDVDYLAGDSPYQAQLTALMKALSDYRADSTSQASRYDVDYGKGLKALGWNDMDGDFATADGEWDLDDPNTAAGRGFTSQRNDFASRGMLQSSDYGRANDLLMRNLNDQRGSMETGRNRFTQDLATQLAAFENENNAAQQSAKQEALLRRAAPYTAI